MFFADKLTFDKPRTTADGFLAVRALASRTGIYDYLGREVDPAGNTFAADQIVKVYRPESEVFAHDSVASFLMKPVTNDHPSTPVTAENWRDYAKGVVGKALRDGDHLAFDLVIMDKATIDDVASGKRALSCGYSSEIDMTPGYAPDGQRYDAAMSRIRGNHCAVVSSARGGPQCRIADVALCDSAPSRNQPDAFHDAKTDEPTSIDEAVAQAFKRMAEPGDVASYLAKLEPKEIDRIVTQAAVAFVRSHQGAGVAKHFATDTLDAELTYRLTQARLKHDMAQGYKPVGQRTPFTAQDAATAVAKATSERVASAVQANDSASEIDRLRSEADGARIARKHLAANAWRR